MLKPFRGIVYDRNVVGDLQSVVSPPYDVITPELQDALYLRSPYNAVRLELNRDASRYESAAGTFNAWLAQGVLRQEVAPALYFYRQEFTLRDGKRRVRRGVVAAMRLEEPSSGLIRPHERTLPSAEADRLELLRACRANFSPIFALYTRSLRPLVAEIEGGLDGDPLADVVDDQGVAHRFWRLTRPDLIQALVSALDGHPAIIADGHHRYQTALGYCRERAGEATSRGDEPFHYIMACLTDLHDDGLVILPTHRLLKGVRMPRMEDLRTYLKRQFRVTLFARSRPEAFFEALRAPGAERRIGLLLAGAEHLWLLSFGQAAWAGVARPEPLRKLDVSVLHALLLEGALGLPGRAATDKLTYRTSEDEALREVDDGSFQAAFFLNPTTAQEVEAVCASGQTMPEKSTYFFPKLLTGLVFHRLNAGAPRDA